jgi:predicted  nucleic acid-binding Zn-ribbon protein
MDLKDFLGFGRMGEIDRAEQHSLSRTATNKDKLQSILNRTKTLRENQETFHRDIYAKLTKINTSIDALLFAKRNAEKKLDGIQQQLRTKEEEQQKLKEEIQKKEKLKHEIEKKLKTTQDENAELTKKIQKLEQDIDKLKEDARKCSVEKDELQQKLRELEKDVDKHDKEIVAIIQQLESELTTIETERGKQPQIQTFIDDILKKLNPSMDTSSDSTMRPGVSIDGFDMGDIYSSSSSPSSSPVIMGKTPLPTRLKDSSTADAPTWKFGGGKPKKKRQKTKKPKNPKNPKKKRKKTKKQKRFR